MAFTLTTDFEWDKFFDFREMDEGPLFKSFDYEKVEKAVAMDPILEAIEYLVAIGFDRRLGEPRGLSGKSYHVVVYNDVTAESDLPGWTEWTQPGDPNYIGTMEPGADVTADCPECWGTGLRSGFQAPCSRGCKQ